MKPTEESYQELQKAYDFYNARLFSSALPPCLITLQRKEYRVLGYFSPQRFGSEQGRRTDELAMNPMHFHSSEPEQVLSTLVHEMTHVWQTHFGHPGRGGYHNREWGTMMKSIGLYPSNTGAPGGRETGDQMSDYIIEGGPFSMATACLLNDGFHLTWAEHYPHSPSATGPGDQPPAAPRNSSNRVRYQCPGCRARVWGKPDLRILCGACAVPFSPAL